MELIRVLLDSSQTMIDEQNLSVILYFVFYYHSVSKKVPQILSMLQTRINRDQMKGERSILYDGIICPL